MFVPLGKLEDGKGAIFEGQSFLRNTFGLVQVTMDLRKSIIHCTEDNVNACFQMR